MRQESKLTTLQRSQLNLTIAFMAPCVAVLLFVVVFPLGYNVWISLYHWNLANPTGVRFALFANYGSILTSGVFWYSVFNTLYFGIVSLVIEFVLGMLIALLLNIDFKGRAVVQTCIIMPMVATPVAASYVWRIMYNPDYGLFNFVLHKLGLPSWNGIFDAATAMPSLILVDVWEWTPFLVLIFSASLLSLPRDTLEAADVDGASSIQKFFYVTLPLMRNVVVIGLVLRGIDLFKTFDIIYSLTGGGPGRITETLNVFTYNTLFTNLEIGYAASLSIVALIIANVILMQLARNTALGGRRRVVAKEVPT